MWPLQIYWHYLKKYPKSFLKYILHLAKMRTSDWLTVSTRASAVSFIISWFLSHLVECKHSIQPIACQYSSRDLKTRIFYNILIIKHGPTWKIWFMLYFYVYLTVRKISAHSIEWEIPLPHEIVDCILYILTALGCHQEGTKSNNPRERN